MVKQTRRERWAEETSTGAGRYRTFVAVLLAMVSVLGALVAWRVSDQLGDAGNSDTNGVLAELSKQEADIRGTIQVFGHQSVYAAFVANRAIADGFYALGDNYTY